MANPDYVGDRIKKEIRLCNIANNSVVEDWVKYNKKILSSYLKEYFSKNS